ncbi:hypothetical protein KA093_01270 [Candidatus Saccharibacteria bacterium]|nr:hypothetical protein [Candidatus Saccharibacteria bacterium]
MQLRITAQAIYDELTARGMDVQIVPLQSTQALIFDYKGAMRVIIGANPDIASASARTMAQAKDMTYAIVRRDGITTIPATQSYADNKAAKKFLQAHRQIVIKPVDGAHGNGVTTNITQFSQIGDAVSVALTHSKSKQVIMQQQISGIDLRILIIDGECVGVVCREPASVVGNGSDTVAVLIQQENTHNRDRGTEPYTKKMNKIELDAVNRYLNSEQLLSVPDQGEVFQVVGTANIGTGGRSLECRADIPQVIIDQAIGLTTTIGTFICGVDFLYDKQKNIWHLLEINTSPSFGLHMTPSEGEAIPDLPKIYVDKLLKKYNKGIYEFKA